jgi:hypothetical protein
MRQICSNEEEADRCYLSDYDGTLCSTTSVRSGTGPVDVEYCNVAGFTHVRKLSLDNPINLLYGVRL